MQSKLPRYTLQLDEQHPYDAVFVRDDSTATDTLPENQFGWLFTDALLALGLIIISYFVFQTPYSEWSSWIEYLGAGIFTLLSVYLGVRYYNILIILYLLVLSGTAAASVLAFFWWIFG